MAGRLLKAGSDDDEHDPETVRVSRCVSPDGHALVDRGGTGAEALVAAARQRFRSSGTQRPIARADFVDRPRSRQPFPSFDPSAFSSTRQIAPW